MKIVTLQIIQRLFYRLLSESTNRGFYDAAVASGSFLREGSITLKLAPEFDINPA